MTGPVGEVQMYRLRSAVEDVSLISGDDVGSGGLGEIGQEDVSPKRGTLTGMDVLNVEDVILEVFVEHSWLNFKGRLT